MNIAHVASRSIFALVCISSLALSATASAQATRTWVSGVGDDANPCSRTAPCKTFAGAISKTAENGEISVLDPGGFGAVTITKGITIDGGGIQGSILASLVNGIIVNAGATDVVILRNLSINGAGNGTNGIRFIAGGALHVENVSVAGFAVGAAMTGNGIDFNPSGASSLHVSNSSFRNNALIGILVRPVGVGSAIVNLNDVRLEENGAGFFQSDGALTVAVNVVSSGNVGAGFQVQTTTGASRLHLDRSTSSGNGSFGVRTDGASAVIRLSNSSIVHNAAGLSTGGGTIVSFQNNTIASNSPGGDGNPTITATLR